MILITYFGLSILVGVYGLGRRIGGLAAFFLSLIISPILGFVITALSVKNETFVSNKRRSLIDAAAAAKMQFDSGAITEKEYDDEMGRINRSLSGIK